MRPKGIPFDWTHQRKRLNKGRQYNHSHPAFGLSPRCLLLSAIRAEGWSAQMGK